MKNFTLKTKKSDQFILILAVGIFLIAITTLTNFWLNSSLISPDKKIKDPEILFQILLDNTN